MESTTTKTIPPQNQAATPRGSSLTWLLWLAFLVLVVYPLSTGPAVWLSMKVPATQPFLEALYAPIRSLCEHCPLFLDLMIWYLGAVWRIPIPIYK